MASEPFNVFSAFFTVRRCIKVFWKAEKSRQPDEEKFLLSPLIYNLANAAKKTRDPLLFWERKV